MSDTTNTKGDNKMLDLSVEVKKYCGDCDNVMYIPTAKVKYKCEAYDKAPLEHDGTGTLPCDACIAAMIREHV